MTRLMIQHTSPLLYAGSSIDGAMHTLTRLRAMGVPGGALVHWSTTDSGLSVHAEWETEAHEIEAAAEAVE